MVLTSSTNRATLRSICADDPLAAGAVAAVAQQRCGRLQRRERLPQLVADEPVELLERFRLFVHRLRARLDERVDRHACQETDGLVDPSHRADDVGGRRRVDFPALLQRERVQDAPQQVVLVK
jgi:hypothetical protein